MMPHAPKSKINTKKRPAPVPEAADAKRQTTAVPPKAEEPKQAPDEPDAVVELEKDASKTKTNYQSPFAGLKPAHPTALCLSNSLDFAQPQDEKAKLLAAVPTRLMQFGQLSDAQLHSAAKAQVAFNSKRAFVLGDATGVGKGRQAMACAASAMLTNGSHRALMISVPGLGPDAKRDFDGIKMADVVSGLKFVDASSSLPTTLPKKCVVFTTYSQICSKGGARFIDLLKPPPGKPPRATGAILLDEVHKCGNANTKTHREVAALLAALPHAPVVGLSATWASSIKGLGLLASRLGLVGSDPKANPFPTFASLQERVGKLGEGGLELLSATLSAQGLLLARSISYAGTTAKKVACTMTDEETNTYAACAALWEKICDSELWKRSQIIGARLRFFKALSLQYKVCDTVKVIEAELAEGRKVVVSVMGTGETAINRIAQPDTTTPAADASSESDEDAEPDTAFSALRDCVEQLFAAVQSVARPGQSAQDIADIEANQKTLAGLRKELDVLRLPEANAIDMLKSKLATHGVVELTGRTKQLVPDANGGWRVEAIARDIEASKRRFQCEDDVKVAILSNACATGISLHDYVPATTSGKSFPRSMVLFELPWSAQQSVQIMGRIHRSGQASLPCFITTAGACHAEKRFSATVSRRLKMLGAIVAADTRKDDDDSVGFDGDLMVSGTGDRASHQFGMRGVYEGRQLLNAALAMPVEKGNATVARFAEIIEQVLKLDIAKGRVPRPKTEIAIGRYARLEEETTLSNGVRLLDLVVDRRINYGRIEDQRDEILAAGGTARFVSSTDINHPGICLGIFRKGVDAVRCTFPSGATLSLKSEKLNNPGSANDNRPMSEMWSARFDSTRPDGVCVALAPCLGALRVIYKSPQLIRVVMADGTKYTGLKLNAHERGHYERMLAHEAQEAEERAKKLKAAAAAAAAVPSPDNSTIGTEDVDMTDVDSSSDEEEEEEEDKEEEEASESSSDEDEEEPACTSTRLVLSSHERAAFQKAFLAAFAARVKP